MVETGPTIALPTGFGASAWRYATAILLMALPILSLTLWWPIENATAASLAERYAKMDALFGALPSYVLQWMSIQRFIMLGCLWSVIWHKEARVYMLATLLSHVISYTEIALAPVERLGLGLVSLNHLIWIPALVLLFVNRKTIDWKSPFGLWYGLALFQVSFSMIFDIPDSVAYLGQQYF